MHATSHTDRTKFSDGDVAEDPRSQREHAVIYRRERLNPYSCVRACVQVCVSARTRERLCVHACEARTLCQRT